MIQFTRGKEERQSIAFDTDPAAFTELVVRYKQHGQILAEKGLDDMELSGDAVAFTLTAEETARFNPYDPIYVQVYAVPEAGIADYTDVIEADAVDVL